MTVHRLHKYIKLPIPPETPTVHLRNIKESKIGYFGKPA